MLVGVLRISRIARPPWASIKTALLPLTELVIVVIN